MMTRDEVTAALGRLLNYRGHPFRAFGIEGGATSTSWTVPGVVFHLGSGRWRPLKASSDGLSHVTPRHAQMARLSLTWMTVNETVGHRIRRGDACVRDGLDVVYLCDEDSEHPDGMVVGTRKKGSEAKVAWLMSATTRRAIR